MKPINQENSKIKNAETGQFQYLNRWVDKANFRAFVYNKLGEKKLANSHDEFESLISTGLWFASKPINEEKVIKMRKPKDALCSAS